MKAMGGGEYFPLLHTSKAHNIRHLMTGTGAYFYIVWGVWLRHCLNYRQDEYKLDWPNYWTMPQVIKRQSANGSRKKEL